MPRKSRIHFPGALYHVILRGNAGTAVFIDDKGRHHFYDLIQQGIERFGYRIHAFCLMTNHVHLLIQVGAVPLSRIIHNLSLRYTVWLNRRHGRIGHLFHGRYKGILVDADNYLVELVRYIHLNPVRAAMVKLPEEYVWSGHRALTGEDQIPWLTTDHVLSQLGTNIVTARRRYQNFVYEALQEGQRKEFGQGTHEGRILGDDTFAEEALRSTCGEAAPPTIDHVLSEVCNHYGITEVEMAMAAKLRRPSEARAVAALLVREIPGLSLTALGVRMRREVSALSRAARVLADKVRTDQAIASELKPLLENFQLMFKC
jgi:putative transposase